MSTRFQHCLDGTLKLVNWWLRHAKLCSGHRFLRFLSCLVAAASERFTLWTLPKVFPVIHKRSLLEIARDDLKKMWDNPFRLRLLNAIEFLIFGFSVNSPLGKNYRRDSIEEDICIYSFFILNTLECDYPLHFATISFQCTQLVFFPFYL